MERHEIIAAGILASPVALVLLFVWWAGGLHILGGIILIVLAILTITGYLPMYLIAYIIDSITKYRR